MNYNTYYYLQLSNLAMMLLFVIFLTISIVSLSYSFSPSNPDREKLSAYECGFDPYEDARNIFDIRFYLVAILFIVFDLEAIFFFPWCVSLSFLSPEAFFGMFDFALELVVGYYYAWKVGALDWE